MALTLFNTRFPSLWSDFDDVFGSLRATARTERAPQELMPPTDVLETEKSIELKLDLPGVTPEAIEIKLEGEVLTVAAERKEEKTDQSHGWVRQERRWGRFARSFVVPDAVVGMTPVAVYKHGVLSVTLPKKEQEQAKTVKVNIEA